MVRAARSSAGGLTVCCDHWVRTGFILGSLVVGGILVVRLHRPRAHPAGRRDAFDILVTPMPDFYFF